MLFVFLCLGMLSPVEAASPLSEFTHGADASIAYLSMIFGVVDGVLHGGGSQIAGNLSNLLSTTLFCIASLLWTYTTFVGVLNTASEGQFLGQKFSSMWVPVRTVIGFCLLVPKGATGYSLIQVIVMSIVVHGVHAANFAWYKTLDYLENGGVFVEYARFLDNKNSKKQLHALYPGEEEERIRNRLIDQSKEVLKSEVCMMTLYYALEQKSRERGALPPLDFSKTLNLQGTRKQGKKYVIQFPSAWKSGCLGHIEWEFSDERSPDRSLDFTQIAAQRMALNLLQPARHIAAKIIHADLKDSQATPDAHSVDAPMFKPTPFFEKGAVFDQSVYFSLVNTAEDVKGILQAKSRNKEKVRKALEEVSFTNIKKDMKKSGWITAGSYYALLTKANGAVARVEPDWNEISLDVLGVCPEEVRHVRGQLLTQQQRDHFDHFINEACDQFSQDEKNRARDYHKAAWMTHESQPVTSENYQQSMDDIYHNWLRNPFQDSAQIFQARMQSVLDEKKDPITALSTIGNDLLQTIERFWKEIYDKKVSWSELVAQDNNLGFVAKEVLRFMAFLPIMGTWIILNFTIGAILVYYVPLIPFLLFFFSTLRWFSSVVIAILAAPIVALGVMDPEGHDFYGQAEQARKLLAELFLRPMLMIFGLVFGVILCTVLFELFHYGYCMMIAEMSPLNGILSGVTQVATTAIYTTAAVSIVTRCFSLIYELPNKAFSWIGWHTEGHSEAEILSQTKGGVDQQLSSIGHQTMSRESGTVSSRSASAEADISVRKQP